ncbi:flavodoxin family protein [Verminephrobacter aporrectodeae]|uniref:Flavodoxin family protein n=1 Tax=Verminephrobacter aporrectodeae subsp. tuberculatae TaxID=1110392 RepID=A0ABT3KN02_9BURK|nr:NAD(P)H-dependent oxidoreductase [Verminephrobacter aporrectodeae]MCW5254860.1 flavodoxin family protein [Verminephrobacter aporrectodeae subsp. tuberculatae]MCW5319701.1 flavodoxin family protein [Verminephrobacter aporrectodeae subsp. tuberculatae]MCW8174744.1 flavodoxin family protein [Verminephrobacter aporrectodeae subsp. tuberculatae]MCW8197698.1 flavodoxin family protein [Verminephrobacter aporrectodeae subsp. tuberculatae]MCW8202285.1 flavodoxin family protein [Verminephrobacter apo
MSTPHCLQHLFLSTSSRAPGQVGNTEWLARRAADTLPAGSTQTWHHLAHMDLPPFIDQRHTTGSYQPPVGDMRTLLDATLAAEHIVFVSPVYWYSIPSPLKTYLDHWSAWMRVPGLAFKEPMGAKTLSLITTSGDRARAQPMIDSLILCAKFLGMRWGGALWGQGGPPGAVQADARAVAEANDFFQAAARSTDALRP